MMAITTLISLVLIFIGAEVFSIDYCHMPYCQNPHIACNNSGEYQEECKHPSTVTVNVSQIIHFHNSLRNNVAAGSRKLKAAMHMTTMQWSKELAEMALLYAKTCSINRMYCFATNEFQIPGKNSALVGYLGPVEKYSDDFIIEQCLNAWSSEERNVNIKIINKFPKSDFRIGAYGHFTLMIHDKNTHIGCAAVRFHKDNYNHLFFVCNYATTNIIDEPVYVTGERPGALCMTGRNPQYKNLCSTSEYYYANLREIYRMKERLTNYNIK